MRLYLTEKLNLKIAFRTAFGGALAWLIDLWLSEAIGWTDRTISGLWCVLSAIIILQSTLGGGYVEGSKRFLGVLVGSLFGALSTSWFGSAPFHLAISLFLTVMIMSLLGLDKSIRIASLSCAVVMIVWSLNPIGSPWSFAFNRFIDSCLGIIVGLFISHLVFPSETIHQLEKNQKELFDLFSQLVRGLQPGGEELSLEKETDKSKKILKDDDSLLEELQAEWIRGSESKEGWQLFHLEEKKVLELLVTSLELPLKEIFPLIDKELLNVTKEALDGLHLSFKRLGANLPPDNDISLLVSKLKEERPSISGHKNNPYFQLKRTRELLRLLFQFRTNPSRS